MRQELLALRKALSGIEPSPLRIEGEVLTLDFELTDVDAREFQRLCRSGQPADLQRAIELHRGRFLDGVQLRDPGGEEWLRGERARLMDLYQCALRALVGHHLRQRDTAEAMAVARRLLIVDPTHEQTHRILMCLIALVDGRAGALRHFDQLRMHMRDDLGIEVEAETARLAERLRAAEDQEALCHLLEEVASDYLYPNEVQTFDRPQEAPAIAVLPFASLGEGDLDVFGDGLVDGITGDLARVRSFFVISRATAETYRGTRIDAVQVGRELRVRYLLTGNVQRAGQRIRVRVQLLESGAGALIWSDTFDGSAEDTFELQDRITERIAGAIAPSVRMAEIERVRRKRPENLAAYDFVMRALPRIWAMSSEANSEALRLTGEAMRLDPHYALAHAYASWCHFWASTNGWTDNPLFERQEAYRLIEKALQLDANDPSVLSIAALAATALGGDLDAAQAYIEKALRLDPNFAWGWNRSGYIQTYLDRTDLARAHFERAALLSPFDPLNFNRFVGLALAAYCEGEYEEAVQWAEKARIERPGLPWAYRVLGAARAELGDKEGAAAAVVRLLADSPSLTVERVMEAMPFRRPDIAQRFAGGLAAGGLPHRAVLDQAAGA
jgi:TolB-like protein